MKILMTGGTGFIGKHLLEQLAEENVSLRIISRKAITGFEKNTNVEIFKADLADVSSLTDAFQDIEVVINLAAELYDESKFESINVRGVKIMAELAKKNNVKKFIHLSSVGVVGMQYSNHKLIVDENSVCHPQNGYEKSKLKSEEILEAAFVKEKEKLVMLRPTNVFGDEHPRNALLNFFRSVQNGKKIVCSNTARVNYVYVKDLVAAIRYFIFNDAAEIKYNVGHAMLFRDFLHECAAIIGVKEQLKIFPKWCFAMPELIGYLGMKNVKSKLRSLSNEVVYADERITNEIPGIYKYGIKIGLENTIKFYRSKGKL